MLPRLPPHVSACGITGRFNTRPSSVLGSTRPSTSPSSAQLVSIQPDGLPRGVAVTVMLSTPPHAQRRRRMLSAAAAGSAPSPLVLLPAPPSPASTDSQCPATAAALSYRRQWQSWSARASENGARRPSSAAALSAPPRSFTLSGLREGGGGEGEDRYAKVEGGNAGTLMR